MSLFNGGGVGTLGTRPLEWGGGGLSVNVNAAGGEVTELTVGLGRIVALHHHASTSYQIRLHIRCLY